MPKKAWTLADRIYWRDAADGSRLAWGYFRDFADVTSKTRIALVPEGGKVATSDPEEALRLAHRELDRLEGLRRKASVLGSELGIRKAVGLQSFAARHLRLKAESGRVTDQWLQVSEQQLRAAVEFFGAARELHTIRVTDVQRYAAWLAQQPVKRGRERKEGEPAKATLSAGSVRKYLNTLSNLFARAQAEEVVPSGHNPVASMMEKPVAAKKEAAWMEAHEVALLLESARTYAPKRADRAMPFLYPLLATFALTGGRESEILGLEVGDVDFQRQRVVFRPNGWRRLKTATSARVVPLHPQLAEVLRDYLRESGRVGGLLFPSHLSAEPAMLSDWRKALDAVAERVGWKAGEVRSKQFRHSYCAARLQTLDRGEPVSTWTVAKELGHGGDTMVRKVYGHLGTVRHRSEHVEFRVEQHRDEIGERLARLRVA